MKKDNYPSYVATIEQLHKNIYNMDEKIKVLEKALELACETIFEEYGCSCYYNKTCNKGDNNKICYQCQKEQYLKQAMEMIKSE